ncbi:MAG: helix-turn-helix transcriptional regulator [Peptococcaceae bacterium]|nr:helix-turn-helix transcriptional regulator [Peptococcaceae bacterium]
MDIQERLRSLMAERHWTEYRLVKESGLPASTVANIFRRNTTPSIITLETLCDAFGLTLSQFFSQDNALSLTDEQINLLKRWATLSEDQKQALISLIEKMN